MIEELEKELEKIELLLKKKNVLDKDGKRMRKWQYLQWKEKLESKAEEVRSKLKMAKEEAKRIRTRAHNARPSALLKEMYEEFKFTEASKRSEELLKTVRVFLTEKGGYSE